MARLNESVRGHNMLLKESRKNLSETAYLSVYLIKDQSKYTVHEVYRGQTAYSVGHKTDHYTRQSAEQDFNYRSQGTRLAYTTQCSIPRNC
jgi:hypothetical protein